MWIRLRGCSMSVEEPGLRDVNQLLNVPCCSCCTAAESNASLNPCMRHKLHLRPALELPALRGTPTNAHLGRQPVASLSPACPCSPTAAASQKEHRPHVLISQYSASLPLPIAGCGGGSGGGTHGGGAGGGCCCFCRFAADPPPAEPTLRFRCGSSQSSSLRSRSLPSSSDSCET